jgi:hypothetical protein
MRSIFGFGGRELREGSYGADATLSKRLPLIPRDSSDEGKMVVISAAVSHSGNHEHTSQCSVGSG